MQIPRRVGEKVQSHYYRADKDAVSKLQHHIPIHSSSPPSPSPRKKKNTACMMHKPFPSTQPPQPPPTELYWSLLPRADDDRGMELAVAANVRISRPPSTTSRTCMELTVLQRWWPPSLRSERVANLCRPVRITRQWRRRKTSLLEVNVRLGSTKDLVTDARDSL